jgi:hypothetical protein
MGQVVLGRVTCIQECHLHNNNASEVEVDVAIGKLNMYKTLGIVQISAELIQMSGGGATLHSEIHKIIKLISNKEELSRQWKELIIITVQKRVIKLTALIIEACNCCQLHTEFYQTFFSLR